MYIHTYMYVRVCVCVHSIGNFYSVSGLSVHFAKHFVHG